MTINLWNNSSSRFSSPRCNISVRRHLTWPDRQHEGSLVFDLIKLIVPILDSLILYIVMMVKHLLSLI
ncbi:hypothetical protein BDV28DRAFT_136851 [Aspergillus coremiiformis]|uniref:Uncharacterized protein n=1 Tax=Aspergillus coremiiformis TaxID=138285 RepID=A0A5N6Z1L0_9EURO|nr:hypothetical protein BDV28DRAFT_136851 [Aspergillus coremiiformis]